MTPEQLETLIDHPASPGLVKLSPGEAWFTDTEFRLTCPELHATLTEIPCTLRLPRGSLAHILPDPERRPVTMWDRWDPKAKQWKYNHLEDGHSMADKPVDKFPERKWKAATWRKAYGHLRYRGKGVPPLLERDA